MECQDVHDSSNETQCTKIHANSLSRHLVDGRIGLLRENMYRIFLNTPECTVSVMVPKSATKGRKKCIALHSVDTTIYNLWTYLH